MTTTTTSSAKLTLASVRSLLAARDVTIFRNGAGDYVVRIKGSKPGEGYFTTDLSDALATGRKMADELLWKNATTPFSYKRLVEMGYEYVNAARAFEANESDENSTVLQEKHLDLLHACGLLEQTDVQPIVKFCGVVGVKIGELSIVLPAPVV